MKWLTILLIIVLNLVFAGGPIYLFCMLEGYKSFNGWYMLFFWEAWVLVSNLDAIAHGMRNVTPND